MTLENWFMIGEKMTIHEKEEFFKIAKEKYGDKIIINRIGITDENPDRYNSQMGTSFTADDFYNYGEHVWVTDSDKCPECNIDLSGIFGSFEWGIVHGEGNCSACGTAFRLYHYIKNNEKPLILLSLIGF